AITRLVDMGVEPYLIASSLSLVIAQRLVRKVCASCARPADVSPRLLTSLGIPKAEAHRLVRVDGCGDCRYGGFQGRVGVFQVLPIGDVIREQIITQVSERTIAHAAEASGV